ncbi:lysylphosphatidylglycerol synthase transmembrane domain-containing protein [Ammoniphilus sp. YIM 78166]|uniref:lysylphosphatidylglycerol synthase transmembrane domain-containing protein n=1 Tax=Ammoniphilus sp. YIM 78166 TaxID=1644106 RepID=UPI00106F7C5F|nr:lysylphosphatidylglycerol synthase transmembrane domain-containing protein [Ammoniphilus sp. YIM 78166]
MKKAISVLLFVWFVYISLTYLSDSGIKDAVQLLVSQWWYIVLFVLTYSFAFYLRSIGWAILIGKSKKEALTLFHFHMVGLLVNHLLPIKAGDGARIYLLNRSFSLNWRDATQSVIYSRWLDLASLLMLAYLAAWGLKIPVLSSPGILIPLVCMMILSWILWNRWGGKQHSLGKLLYAGIWIFPGWVLEGFVLWCVVQALHLQLPFSLAVGINAVTIAGQIFHVTPGGIGTYESVMSWLLQEVGLTMTTALEIAIMSHGLKFIYSYTLGAYSLFTLKLKWKEVLAGVRQKEREARKR